MTKKSIKSIKELLRDTDKVKKKSMPSIIHPMLATLTHNYFFESDWIYERKLDGERCIAWKKGDKVLLKSRNNLNLNISYPEIKQALEKQIKAHSIILDGEVVAFKGRNTSFSALQRRMHVLDEERIHDSKVKVYYYIFDILYLDGYDVTKLPLVERKKILKNICTYKDPLRLSQYRYKTSQAYLDAACKKGWEGLIAKDAQSPYVHKRSSSWLKFKCVQEQELVIGGYTDPAGSRVGFGAILVGYYKRGKLHYAGKIGTGFDTQTLKSLKKEFDKLATATCPFVNYDDIKKGVHWIKPKLVCEVGFEEWTNDNKLRHGRYLGLRRDKSAKKVIQEK